MLSDDDMKLARKRFYQHKDNARRRKIPFLFSFSEWLQIWLDSGHWYERGCRNDQYVMSRIGDKGPYSKNNVVIQLAVINQKSKKVSNEMKRKLIQRLLGNKYTLGYKHSQESKQKMSEKFKGRPVSEEVKEKISKTLRGHKVSNETRQKISITKKLKTQLKDRHNAPA